MYYMAFPTQHLKSTIPHLSLWKMITKKLVIIGELSESHKPNTGRESNATLYSDKLILCTAGSIILTSIPLTQGVQSNDVVHLQTSCHMRHTRLHKYY
jgi:hypothetical protein